MSNSNNLELKTNDFNLEKIISTSIQVPGVKVDRKKLLAETFSDMPEKIQDILEYGTLESQISREELNKRAQKLILTETSKSSVASFLTGIPGGLAMAATVPADILQFFGMSLRLAQELSYIYGGEDLWGENGEVDDERVKNQLVLYCGVMFGVSGASAGVRILSKQVAETALKKIPQKALTKTFWYPIVKQIGKAIGIKVTKSTVAKGVSKAIPIVGGVISGGLNFASMMPMAKRLHSTLDEAAFGYTQEAMEADIEELSQFDEDTVETETINNSEITDLKDKVSKGLKNASNGISNLFSKHNTQTEENKQNVSDEEIFAKIEKLAKLKDMGAITEEEFAQKKVELLDKI